MPDKETFNAKEKAEVLKSFGETLDDRSLRILKALKSEFGNNPKKDLNMMLDKAYSYRGLC
ncbi:hypothetical protein [Labilibaculum antarcticum]|uniref:Uncharacterized protein n=1 Tax=Labilibaculum antarcticum TaxID=1717717 RepID=A0A1Y1CIC4_9BACT|nr:hypothetical protein [Labilibaculum antarcticum]BAX79041.1 hypothetical protein ALGA_0652 [Labilibaculum antarcticum]